MGIFKRKKQDPEEPQVDLYSPQMLAKRLLWDIVPCGAVPSYIPLMGLVPDSADVADMEHQASHARLERIRPIADLLEIFSPLVSGITASAMLVNSGTETMEPELASALQKHHAYVVQVSLQAVIAELLDMGVLSYTDGVQIGE